MTAGHQVPEAVDRMVAAAATAQQRFASWPEAEVDALLADIAAAVAERAHELADHAVQETGIGNVPDKVEKIRFASLGVYASLAGLTGTGRLGSDDVSGVIEIASPVGVIFGLVPVTEPVGTFVNKALFCLKARNALILSCHRSSRGVGDATCSIIQGVLRRHGASPFLVQSVPGPPSREHTRMFMTHPGIGLILATGGPSVVSAAYSCGKPAIGVGPGNTPAWVCADADVRQAAASIVASKSFDHGVTCGSEQHVLVDASVQEGFVAHLLAYGAMVLDREQSARLLAAVKDPATGQLARRFVGRPAVELARAAGLEPGARTRLLVLTMDAEDASNGGGGERPAPLVSLFTVRGDEEARVLCRRLLDGCGAGHTAVVHTNDVQRVERFACEMPVSRILVNVPAAHGAVGAATGLPRSLSLGCGTFAGNSTTDNVTYRNVMNVKRVAFPVR
jgi:acyl-CoA reductase-like NAD-dependent aldehyde dehydrogenase